MTDGTDKKKEKQKVPPSLLVTGRKPVHVPTEQS